MMYLLVNLGKKPAKVIAFTNEKLKAEHWVEFNKVHQGEDVDIVEIDSLSIEDFIATYEKTNK